MYTALALGSNIGNRLENLKQAIVLLEEKKVITDIIPSSIFESQALLKENSPKEWDLPFLNMVIRGKTNLDPQTLLAEIKSIEKKIGRIDRGEWAPREIDIDIIAIENIVLETKELTIPHPRMLERKFVLVPLLEIWPDFKYPVKGMQFNKTVEELLRSEKGN